MSECVLGSKRFSDPFNWGKKNIWIDEYSCTPNIQTVRIDVRNCNINQLPIFGKIYKGKGTIKCFIPLFAGRLRI